jgi:excisionase family DNA binding protein
VYEACHEAGRDEEERMAEDQQRLLNVTEAARRLGIHPHTLRAWADKGLVPVVRTLTGYRRFDPEELDRVIAEMRSGKLAA